MHITKAEYESAMAQLATRVELNNIKFTVEEMDQKLKEVSERSLQDSDLFSKTLVDHKGRIKLLEKKVREARQRERQELATKTT